jgi:hypothetical protein
MRSHAEFFRGGLCAAFGIEPVGNQKLAEWVDTSSSSLMSPTSVGYPQTLHSLSSLRPILAFEAASFTSAALESYSTVRAKWSSPEDRDGLAWRFVSLYYAAYYAAHAILRLSGTSVTQINSWSKIEGEFNMLHQSTLLPALGLEKGYHVLKLEASGSSVSVSKAKVDSAHGTHTALWREFKQLADFSYANNALNTSLHQAAVGAYSGKLATSITIDGSHCQWPWMPAVRNRINYRLPEQIWGANSKRIIPRINKRIHDLIDFPTSEKIIECSDDKVDWLRFTASCVYVVSLLCHLIRDMELRAKSKNALPALFKLRAPIIQKLSST